MPALYSVQVRTHTGSVREINEDAVSTVLDWRSILQLSDKDLLLRGHLFAIADGMGGHAAGEVASRLTIESLFRSYYTSDWTTPQITLSQAIAAANETLCAQAEEEPSYAGMGTTLVAAVLLEDTLLVANVGDSRGYISRDGSTRQITDDHSWVAEQVAAGVLTFEEAARHPYRNVITRSLGPDREARPDFFDHDIQAGDLLLLCTDGLSNLVTNDEIDQLLTAYPPDEAANLLQERALERGAPDNVSLVLVDILESSQQKKRSIWPWFALLVVAALLVGFIFGERWLGSNATPAAQPLQTIASLDRPPTAPSSGTEQAKSITPTQSGFAASPLVTPTSQIPLGSAICHDVIELAATGPGTPAPDVMERFGRTSDLGDRTRGLPQGNFVYYLEGYAEFVDSSSDAKELRIIHMDEEGVETVYVAVLDSDGLTGAGYPGNGSWLGLVAEPQTSECENATEILRPLVLLAPQGLPGEGKPFWVKGGDLDVWLEQAAPLWIYTVYGPGGGDGLGIAMPPGQMGQALALWGGWQPSLKSGLLQFSGIESEPYEWQSDVYRQAGKQ